jgi:hypothetical protein
MAITVVRFQPVELIIPRFERALRTNLGHSFEPPSWCKFDTGPTGAAEKFQGVFHLFDQEH